MQNGRPLRRISKALRRLPNLLRGYNLYVNGDKLRLIDTAFTTVFPGAASFADLGGAWKVNGAYSVHTMRREGISRGVIIDTDFPRSVATRLARIGQLRVVRADFALRPGADAVGNVDVVFFFDVLLHQARPHWNEVLSLYAGHSPCFVIYNQQYVRGTDAVRLTDLPLVEYESLVPRSRGDIYRYVYDHRNEIHPEYGKPWGDIHNIFQWGITDAALRGIMDGLGFNEVYFMNHGTFSDLPAFENHAFIFKRRRA